MNFFHLNKDDKRSLDDLSQELLSMHREVMKTKKIVTRIVGAYNNMVHAGLSKELEIFNGYIRDVTSYKGGISWELRNVSDIPGHEYKWVVTLFMSH